MFIRLVSDRCPVGDLAKQNLPRGETELTSVAILDWAQDKGIDWQCVAHGEPQQ